MVAVGTLALLTGANGPSTPDFESAEPTTRSGREGEGADLRVRPSKRPRVEAAFTRESYRAGSVARLVIFSDVARNVSIQFFRAGTEDTAIKARDDMYGTAASEATRLGVVRQDQKMRLSIPHGPSGLYFAKLMAAGQRVGYAPFVLRPRRLGEHQVALVLPTLTWQAYNRRDDDGDGQADTWYADPKVRSVLLGRPFDQRGVPPNYKSYDQPFLRWLIATGKSVDYLSQSDIANASGRQLARAYGLLIFSGHHEYVTRDEYDTVEDFRDRGGNLMFLSANNFFWKAVIRSNRMSRVAKWRDVGRPEAALVGVQYIGNDGGTNRDAFHVRETAAASWLFAGTGLSKGLTFGRGFGIEIDKQTSRSPRGIQILAELPDLLGPGMTGQMTYYKRGDARVFAAGAFGLVAHVWSPPVDVIMGNLWAKLEEPPVRRAAPHRAARDGRIPRRAP